MNRGHSSVDAAREFRVDPLGVFEDNLIIVHEDDLVTVVFELPADTIVRRFIHRFESFRANRRGEPFQIERIKYSSSASTARTVSRMSLERLPHPVFAPILSRSVRSLGKFVAKKERRSMKHRGMVSCFAIRLDNTLQSPTSLH